MRVERARELGLAREDVGERARAAARARSTRRRGIPPGGRRIRPDGQPLRPDRTGRDSGGEEKRPGLGVGECERDGEELGAAQVLHQHADEIQAGENVDPQRGASAGEPRGSKRPLDLGDAARPHETHPVARSSTSSPCGNIAWPSRTTAPISAPVTGKSRNRLPTSLLSLRT